jgi:hypothetical protein
MNSTKTGDEHMYSSGIDSSCSTSGTRRVSLVTHLVKCHEFGKQISLDCPFLIAPSVISNIYLPVSLDCPFLIALSVFSNVYLPVSLECPFLIAPAVFSNVYLHLSCFLEFK